jgi:predicted GIY-YIG superfamily endonuclease
MSTTDRRNGQKSGRLWLWLRHAPTKTVHRHRIGGQSSIGGCGMSNDWWRTKNMRNKHDKRQNHRYYIYVLKCCDDQYYAGQTTYIITRLWQHFTGIGAVFTKQHPPCGLVHLEIRRTRDEALAREAELIWAIKKNRPIKYHLPEEFEEFFYRIAAMADSPSEDCRENCNIFIDIPHVAEWEKKE